MDNLNSQAKVSQKLGNCLQVQTNTFCTSRLEFV